MNILKKKSIAISKLTKKALKDKFIGRPSKGFKYLKDLEIGSAFKIPLTKTKGILIEKGVNARVIIIETRDNDNTSLGKKIISIETEVKLI
jgi:hypothetical protein|tara:strand:- start:1398 stop:1670 length:273 start_codon:yes stop_codon:yes gene_type:complete